MVHELRRAVAAAALALCGAAAGSDAPPPDPRPATDDYAREPRLSAPVLSPSGGHLAMIATAPNGRQIAVVQAVQGDTTPKVVVGYGDAHVRRLEWINDERLLVVTMQADPTSFERGSQTLAIDRDGGNERQLLQGSHLYRMGSVSPGWFVHSIPDDGSADVVLFQLAVDSRGELTDSRLVRLDSRSGRSTPISDKAPSFAYQWLLDAQGTLRVVATQRDGRHRIHWLAPGSESWKVVLDQPLLSPERLVPRHLEGDGTLLVEGRAQGQDTEALWSLDLGTARLDPEPVVALKGYDIDLRRVLDRRTRQLMGVRMLADRPVTAWFVERMARAQRDVDQALPGRTNRLDCTRCASSRHVVVTSSSDTHPGEHWLYDLEQRRLLPIGPSRPWLDPARQGRRTLHRVPARDGLPLPVYVTHPARAAAEPLPTVVLVHGGPWLRGSDLLWSQEAQFLASRGYRVLEVEFRGSLGYGWRHFRAGWKQWGQAMQDDLADAVAWAAREKLTDPARVCLYGASYGGYAALMGPIRHPGVYRCAAGFAAPTDPALIYTATWGDMLPQAKAYTLPALLGDPSADAAMLEAASPLKRVAELKVPVLLAYGQHDARVPREHADRFERAAKAAGARIEVVTYPETAHGWFNASQHADFLRRLDAFLARELR